MLSKIRQSISGLLQVIRPALANNNILTNLEDMDVGVTPEFSRYDLESFQVEEGHIVGTTFVFEDEKLVITNGPHPDSTKSEYFTIPRWRGRLLIKDSHTGDRGRDKRYHENRKIYVHGFRRGRQNRWL